ncbi:MULTISPECIES: hypothetical protein [Alphaproteobacteria]|uniref:hypothetical protein n=1 Tax=Alphaproteobacteria TaxID=28211 RepID=UPI003297D283
MKIEERVTAALHVAIAGDFFVALDLICPAIEASARKDLGKNSITRNEYKDFLRKYNTIIEAFSGPGINLDETRFPDISIKTDNGKTIERPDFSDLIYHAFRCALAHGHEISDEFVLTEEEDEDKSHWLIGLQNGHIHMPRRVVWALIAVVVFCRANQDITTESNLWLTWTRNSMGRNEPYRFDIDIFWGAEETVRRFLERQNLSRVALNF